jgi:hypothetical protein
MIPGTGATAPGQTGNLETSAAPVNFKISPLLIAAVAGGAFLLLRKKRGKK